MRVPGFELPNSNLQDYVQNAVDDWGLCDAHALTATTAVASILPFTLTSIPTPVHLLVRIHLDPRARETWSSQQQSLELRGGIDGRRHTRFSGEDTEELVDILVWKVASQQATVH
jgi:hypothetical protein